MVVPVNEVYIDMIKAFRADCETLIGRFSKEKTYDLKTFCYIWHDLDFKYVYAQPFSKNATEYDFKNDTLQIAKLIMLREHFSGGMFLMSGLYFLQLQLLDTCTIRLELNEFRQILNDINFKEEEPKTNKLELGCIFAKLLKKNAFDFVAFGREYDLEGRQWAEMIYENQYEFPEDGCTTREPIEWMKNFIKKEVSQESLNVDNNYLKLQRRVKEVYPSLNLSLDMVQKDTVMALLHPVIQPDVMAEPDDNIGERRQALKRRKMLTKHRLDHRKGDISGEEKPSPPSARKRGAPKGFRVGRRKYFFHKIINEPGSSSDSTHSDSSDAEILDADFSPSDLPEL